jgi:Putative transposase
MIAGHLGADIGFIGVLHTWGQNLDHHPHVHCIVPAGGISPDGQEWVRCRPNFFLPVRVLSRLFRRLFTERLMALHGAGELQFFGNLACLATARAFNAYLAPLRKCEWVVYAKHPFAGPGQVLSYLARYTHRVAISNGRILSLSDAKVSFRWKDYRQDGKAKVMMLAAREFMRRFLLHVLPGGFHRIRHYGLFANGHRAERIKRCLQLLRAAAPLKSSPTIVDLIAHSPDQTHACSCCGGRMKIVETFDRGPPFSARPQYRQPFDSS